MDIGNRLKAALSGLTGKSATYSSESPHQWWMSGGNVSFDGGIGGAETKSAIVYGCISRRAKDMAGVPLLFLRDPEDITSEMPDTDPVKRLFESPFPGFSLEQFMLYVETMYLARGEAFIAFDDPARPSEMMPFIDPKNVMETTASDGRIVEWAYRGTGPERRWLPSEIMQIRTVNLKNPYRGQSPLQAAASAYQIDYKGDKLQAETIDSGGERGVVFMTPKDDDRTDDQREKLKEYLLGRKTGGGSPRRDTLIPYVEVLDPKLTEADMDLLSHQAMSAEKISDVYGVPLFLLGRADAPNYATAKLLVDNYWRGTVLPDMRAMESVWDRYFVNGPMRTRVYVRFDRSKIQALQADRSKLVEDAVKLAGIHVPLVEINRAFELGLEDAALPTGTDPLVSSTLAPLSAVLQEWKNPAPGGAKMATAAPQHPAPAGTTPPGGRLTQKVIRQRAKSPRAIIARNRRLGRLERGLRDDWKKFGLGYRRRAGSLTEAFLADYTDAGRAAPLLADMLERELMAEMTDRAAEMVAPYHTKAAGEGVLAIQALVDGKVSHADRDLFLKAPAFNPEAAAAIARRSRFVKNSIADLFGEIREWIVEAATETGATASSLAQVVLGRFDVSISRAMTIGRTEIGSAYSVGRYTEMGAQGFEEHEWLTAQDEFVRDTSEGDYDHTTSDGEVRKIGDEFPCGLRHPMEEGGDAGNVINCRCETIPFVRGLSVQGES